MSSEQPHADHLADLNHPDISDFSQKDNIALLRKTVHPPERLLVLAEGARKRFSNWPGRGNEREIPIRSESHHPNPGSAVLSR